jgi:hypothetical protein
MARVNEWLQDGTPVDARRQLVDALIERVEIPEFKPHAHMTLVVQWTDGEQTTIKLNHAAKHIWGYDEQETLTHYMSANAPQAVLCAALPTRKWSAIQQQIRRNYGKGTEIGGVGTVKADETFVEYAHIEHDLQVSKIEEITYWKASGEWVITVHDAEGKAVFISGSGEMLRGKWRRKNLNYRQSR